jgi:hypothetical protein
MGVCNAFCGALQGVAKMIPHGGAGLSRDNIKVFWQALQALHLRFATQGVCVASVAPPYRGRNLQRPQT